MDAWVKEFLDSFLCLRLKMQGWQFRLIALFLDGAVCRDWGDYN